MYPEKTGDIHRVLHGWAPTKGSRCVIGPSQRAVQGSGGYMQEADRDYKCPAPCLAQNRESTGLKE